MPLDAGNEISIISSDALSEALSKINDATKAEEDAQTQLHEQEVSNLTELYNLKVQLAGRAKQKQLDIEKEARAEYLKIRQEAIEAEIKAEEKKRGHKLSDADKKAIRAKYKYDAETKAKFEAKSRKKRAAADKKEARENGERYLKEQQELLLGKGQDLKTRLGALKELTHSTDSSGNSKFDLKKSFGVMAKTLSSLTQQLDKKVDEIASNKAAIDTRLQGSHNDTNWAGSYWEKMGKTITGISGVSPIYKQEDIVNNVKDMVGKGISYNVTQRAFLQTISEKIATTFDASNGTLLRLVRIQQQDTTAGRLGMESALNSFLNSMYETTEYMGSIMEGVKSNIEESMSLMGAKDAVAFEYQVQKWMGSLYSVGMSQNAVSGISSALGKLASGDIEGLMGSGTGNLMVMAANQANLSISDILAQGLDESSTNKLMQAMVNYLSDIYQESSDSRVVQQQMANIYGVAASDLKAATNLAKSNSTMNSILGNAVNYSEGIARLEQMANTMIARTSVGEILTNTWENFQYTMAAGMANNPVMYMLNKTAGLLDQAVGGIAIPAISVMGNMVDLHTTVADLMRVGAMSGSILSGMGAMIGGGGGFSATKSLHSLGIGENLKTVTRGEVTANQRMVNLMNSTNGSSAKRIDQGGTGTSESGMSTMVGNASGSDVKEATMSDASNEQNSQMTEAKESEDNSVTNEVIDGHIVDIFNLLQDVIDGASSLSVKFAEGMFPGTSGV